MGERCRSHGPTSRATHVDCVGDVAAIADTLGIDRFAVSGGSGGAPHALRSGGPAARAGDRNGLLGVACAVRRLGLRLARRNGSGQCPVHRDRARRRACTCAELEGEATEILERIADDPGNWLGDEWQVSHSDQAELARRERHEVTRGDFAEAFRNGVWGWVYWPSTSKRHLTSPRAAYAACGARNSWGRRMPKLCCKASAPENR
jgi:hypothetical protein